MKVFLEVTYVKMYNALHVVYSCNGQMISACRFQYCITVMLLPGKLKGFMFLTILDKSAQMWEICCMDALWGA
jgi:hypothetical protein